MDKPRIFLGSSGKQAKLLQALTRGLDDVAHVEPWTTSFNPGTTTLERLLELAREVDFAVFVFARDDWTTTPAPAPSPPHGNPARPRRATTSSSRPACSARPSACAGPSSSMPAARSSRRDLLGLTSVRYDDATTAAEMRVVNQKLRKAIEDQGRLARIEGYWWQYSLTERSEREPSAISLLRISRDRDGAPGGERPLMAGRRQAVGAVLERGGEGEEGAVGHLLLLERRTATRPERAAAGRDRGDPAGVRRSRGRLLHDAVGHASQGSTRGRPGSTGEPSRGT